MKCGMLSVFGKKEELSMKAFAAFVKSEIVLVLSLVLAVGSAFIIPPDGAYIGYIDFRTLALLFCLMAVMAGLNRLGVFSRLADGLLHRVHTLRGLSMTLTLLCFFSAMVVTNDVALITFVPFSVVALRYAGREDRLIGLITLETVAANLGSMLTPVGNPQNLYLFSAFSMEAGAFFRAVLPYGLLSLVLTAGAVLFLGKTPVAAHSASEDLPLDRRRCGVYLALFALSLLTVFRAVPWGVTLAVTVAAVLVMDRRCLWRVDYSLLLTFVFLFIFIGNLGRIGPVSEFLQRAVTGREVLAGVLASQVFSNVPAAILLSGFTDNAADLLVGVNLGGLGTLIASMASLISFKYVAKGNVSSGKYLLVFTAVNLLFLGANLALWLLIR